jgi:hypothetical protein
MKQGDETKHDDDDGTAAIMKEGKEGHLVSHCVGEMLSRSLAGSSSAATGSLLLSCVA